MIQFVLINTKAAYYSNYFVLLEIRRKNKCFHIYRILLMFFSVKSFRKSVIDSFYSYNTKILYFYCHEILNFFFNFIDNSSNFNSWMVSIKSVLNYFSVS